MKAILKFDLPEEQEEFEIANHGWKYRLVITELDQHLRNKIKYDNKINDDQYDCYEEIRKKLWDLINEEKINLY